MSPPQRRRCSAEGNSISDSTKFSVGCNASRKHRGEGTFYSERYFTRKAADHTVGGLFTYVDHLALRGSVSISVPARHPARQARGWGGHPHRSVP